MSLTLNRDLLIQGGTCEEAMAEIEKYFIENNISVVSFDEVIAYWKQINRRDWAVWAYENKKVFESLVSYTPSIEEDVHIAETLEDLNSFEHVGYVVNGVHYKTLEEAVVARQNNLALVKEDMEKLVVCNLEEKHENGDATWVLVDLDNLQLSDNCVIKVFNPITGVHTTHNTLEDALAKRNALIIEASDCLKGTTRIGKVLQHKDFKEDIDILYEF